MNSLERARLVAAVQRIPDHYAGGYEWEWNCADRHDESFPNCKWDNPEHDHDLISRDRVLALLADESDVSAVASAVGTSPEPNR